MNRVSTRNILGIPTESGGPLTAFSGEPQVRWDLWIFPDHSMQVEYTKRARRIWTVTLMARGCG
jgi:hypothetical protein